MSYAEVIKQCIYENIDKYNKAINDKYKIPYNDLMNLFYSQEQVKCNKSENNSENNSENDDQLKILSKKSKKDLQKMCLEINQSDKGKKEELIKRIMRGKIETVLDRIKTTITSIIVKKNEFDNYEHIESGLVFNRITKCVIGKQDHNTGDVLSLNEDDIEICKQYKFKFDIPKNLNEEDDIEEDEDDEEEEEDDDEEDEDEEDD